MLDFAIRQVTKAIYNIQLGNINPYPLQDGNKTVCEYCEFKALCNYDNNNPHNVVNVESVDKLKELDESKPLIKPGSYIFNLFYEPQENWGLRGTPHLWQAMAREFSNDMIFNTTKGMFKEKYLRVFKKLTGKDLFDIQEEKLYCEKYAFGGMSSGFIWVDFFKK